MYQRQQISEFLAWVAALGLAFAPTLLATDFGGILPWSKYVAALTLTLACGIAAISRLLSIGTPSEARLPTSAFALTGLITLLITGAALQTLPLPQSVVAWLSPASHSAYVDWAGQLIDVGPTQKIPISIAAFDSRHSIACLAIVLMLSFFAVLLFHHRGRITWLLSAIAIFSCSVALIGLARKLVPEFHLWSFRSGGEGAPFGTFLNRNNAAFAINLGIATALGLMVRRNVAFATLNGIPNPNNPFAKHQRSAPTWFRDTTMILLLVSICICLVGLIACGSRGGLLSTLIAGAATGILLRRRIGRVGIALAAAAVVAVLVLALLRTNTLGNQTLREDTLEQIGASVQAGGNRLSTDTRLEHWPDGFRTALKHFPAGSGLASYGYAYLPWQQSSPWRHCLHADNLWLEMFVELGLFGLLLTAIAAWLLVQSLLRLRVSPDPVDQGLSAMGCYLSIVIGISQIFDFGMIVPANLFAVTMILPLIVSRSATAIASPDNSRQGKTSPGLKPKLVLLQPSERWWKSPIFVRERLFQIGSMAALLLGSFLAIDRLRLDSEIDFAVRSAEIRFAELRTDYDGLGNLITDLQQLAHRHAHPELLDVLTTIRFQQGRLLELAMLNIARMPASQQTDLYRSTSRTRRRLGWRAATASLSENVSDSGQPVNPLPVNDSLLSRESPFVLALRDSEASLRQRPLALTPRVNQIFLEFVYEKPERTTIAIVQSASLFRNTPELQLRFGSLAADHGDFPRAAQLWKRAATLDTKMMTRVLGRAIHYPGFPINDSIPPIDDRIKIAKKFLDAANYKTPTQFRDAG